MGTIYQIECLETGLVYIGKTTQTLKKRFSQHKNDSKIGQDRCTSYEVLKNGFAFASVIEIVDDENKLSEREYYYIQHTDCVNISGRAGKSYRKKILKKDYSNSDPLIEYFERCRITNEDYIRKK